MGPGRQERSCSTSSGSIPPRSSPCRFPRSSTGIWEGKLKLNAGIELRLALKVEKGKDGALKATLASPDQGANNIPISSIGLKDNVLTFESKTIGAKFTGKKNEKGTAFEGEFNQSGVKLPLRSRRRTRSPSQPVLKCRSLRSRTARKTSSMRTKPAESRWRAH